MCRIVTCTTYLTNSDTIKNTDIGLVPIQIPELGLYYGSDTCQIKLQVSCKSAQLFHALINMCVHHTLTLKLSSFQVFDLLAVGYHGYYMKV